MSFRQYRYRIVLFIWYQAVLFSALLHNVCIAMWMWYWVRFSESNSLKCASSIVSEYYTNRKRFVRPIHCSPIIWYNYLKCPCIWYVFPCEKRDWWKVFWSFISDYHMIQDYRWILVILKSQSWQDWNICIGLLASLCYIPNDNKCVHNDKWLLSSWTVWRHPVLCVDSFIPVVILSPAAWLLLMYAAAC